MNEPQMECHLPGLDAVRIMSRNSMVRSHTASDEITSREFVDILDVRQCGIEYRIAGIDRNIGIRAQSKPYEIIFVDPGYDQCESYAIFGFANRWCSDFEHVCVGDLRGGRHGGWFGQDAACVPIDLSMDKRQHARLWMSEAHDTSNAFFDHRPLPLM